MNRARNENVVGANSKVALGRGALSSDAELVQAARRGDKRAFVEIVARHQAMVCGVALGILGNFAASEDAAQEAFLTAWRKFHDLREPERLRAWLFQIARNAALGHLRRTRGEDALDDALNVVDGSPTPDEAAANEEDAALVRQSLAELPELYRMPLILFYREGQSVHAVAEALGISEDAVKQRLARGREMLRDRMSGLIEKVLTRTRPSPIFTMGIAAAIGALATPAAVAGSVFAAASAGAGTASTAVASTTPILTAMNISKSVLITAALVTAVCIPAGYYARTGRQPLPETQNASQVEAGPRTPAQKAVRSYENSALFAEWRQLHDIHGRNGEAMPALYKAIADIKDPFRRRAFRAALIAEWAQVDPAGGLAFFVGQMPDDSQRRQFFEEWLASDACGAVDALMASGPGWEGIARDSLTEIARRVPARVADIVSRLPKSDNYWDTKVRDAFAIVAEGGLTSARSAAEVMTGPNREQALAGVAQAWAKSDLAGAISWAEALPEGPDRDEIIRAALLGKAAVDPVTALDLVGLVPPGGRQGYFATTTGARVLQEAAKADFDATAAWIAAHPGVFGHEDMLGMARAVTERLNADAAGFLTSHAVDGSLMAILPAIHSALLNEGSGQRAAVWDWLKTQPASEASKALKEAVLRSAGWQDPGLALRLAADLPRTPEGDSQVQSVAGSLLNQGQCLHRFDSLLAQAPERLRQPLIEAAFNFLRADDMEDPQRWIARLSLLPEASRARGIESIARAWAEQTPEEAIGWVASLALGETRNGALAAIASKWAAKDAYGAAEWVAAMAPGAERDRSAGSLVFAIAETFPRQAWDWGLSIGDTGERTRALTQAAKMMAARDPATARQWIETGPFTPEIRAELQSALDRTRQSSGPR
jgi:RNA polymerase sigma factor (sigma-70 family)